MKTKVYKTIFVVMVLVLLISMGASQAKASPDTPDGSQTVGEDSYFTFSRPVGENYAQEAGNDQGVFLDGVPEVMAGINRVTVSAANAFPWNSQNYSKYRRTNVSCLGVKVADEGGGHFHGAVIPIDIPLGSRITSMYFTGVDNFNGPERTLIARIDRDYWDGITFETIKALHSGVEYATPNVFTVRGDVNHVVAIGWTYTIFLDLFPYWGSDDDIESLKICQIGIEYIPPSVFANAFPTVMTKP